MGLIVKICGLSSEETVDAALDAGADMIGLVLFPKSPRFVTLARAAELASRARGRAEIVALTVDMDDASIDRMVETLTPDWLQMHGSESFEAVAAVRSAFGVKVMKALPVSAPFDLERASKYAAVADRLLLDAKPPKGADRPGGHGRPFDWALLKGFAPPIPYLLSGGLTPQNVEEAVRVSGAPGVDVSSGVETAPGRKDPDLIRAFIAAARRAAASLPQGRMPERVAS
jgi:phosphoribosylanthranilate isomerase